MGSGSKRDSTYLIKNAPSDRVEAPSPSDAPMSEPPDGRWRTSHPPPGESLEAKWWPDRELGKAFRRWTGIPPARGDDARTAAMKFLIERLNVGELTAVGTAPRTPLPELEPPDFTARVHTMVVRLGMHGPNEEAPDHSALLAMGEEVLPTLRNLFPGRLWFNRWEPHVQPPKGRSVSGLCRTLVAFGDRAAPYIGQLLKSDDPETATTRRWSPPSYRTRFSSNPWPPPSSTTIRASRGARCMRWRSSMNRRASRGSRSRSAHWPSRRTPTSAHACLRCARLPFSATRSALKRSFRAVGAQRPR